jgi:hypothetical protein
VVLVGRDEALLDVTDVEALVPHLLIAIEVRRDTGIVHG